MIRSPACATRKGAPVRAPRLALAAGLVLTACGASPPPRQTPAASGNATGVALPAPRASSARRPPLPEYRLAASAIERFASESDAARELSRHGIIAYARRYPAEARDELRYVDQTPVSDGVALPRASGGGFLFWHSVHVYRTTEFAGPLEPVAKLRDLIEHVSVHPRGALIHAGGRWLLDLERRAFVPVEPDTLWDVVTDDRGKALGVTTLGELVTFRPGQAFRGVADSSNFVAVTQSGDWLAAIPARGRDGRLRRLREDGSFADATLPVAPARDAAPGPFERAVSSGLRISDEGWFWQPESARIVAVNLRTEETSWMSSPLFADSKPRACQLVRIEREVSLVCRPAGHPTARFLVFGRTLDRRPQLRHEIVATTGRASPNAWVFDGHCDAQHPSGICIYRRGRFVGHDVDPQLENVLWLPTTRGEAVGLVPGDPWQLVDPVTGNRKVLAASVSRALQQIRFSSEQPLDSRFVVDGSVLRGSYSYPGRLVALDLESGPLSSEHDAVRCQSGSRMITGLGDEPIAQSLDYGKTWQPIAPPYRGNSAEACSEVGSHWRTFIRLGWRPAGEASVAPAPTASIEPSGVTPSSAARAPVLHCTTTGKVRRYSTKAWPCRDRRGLQAVAPIDDPYLDFEAGWACSGPEHQGLIARHQRTMRHAPWQLVFGDLGSPDKRRHRALLAATPTGHVAPFPLVDLDRAIYRDSGTVVLSSGTRPGLGWLVDANMEQSAWFFATSSGRPGAGWLLAPKRGRDLGASVSPDGVLFVSLETLPAALSLLHRDGQKLVLDRETELPTAGDAVPVTLHGTTLRGEPVWLRLTDGIAGPVYALPTEAPPQRLAPWASMRLASAPGCQPSSDDIRVAIESIGGDNSVFTFYGEEPNVIHREGSDARFALQGSVEEETLLVDGAIVRWDPQRVCIEAMELSTPEDEDRPLRTLYLQAGIGALVSAREQERERMPVHCELRY